MKGVVVVVISGGTAAQRTMLSNGVRAESLPGGWGEPVVDATNTRLAWGLWRSAMPPGLLEKLLARAALSGGRLLVFQDAPDWDVLSSWSHRFPLS